MTHGTRRAALLAGTLGIRAYDAGKPASSCPFGASRPLARRAFLAGYSARRRAVTGKDLADIELDQDVDTLGS